MCPKGLMHFLQNVEFNNKQVRPIVENNRIRGEIAHSKPRDHTRM
jgi:hypothetical protein